MASPMEKEPLSTMCLNLMISNITKVTGKMECPMAQAKPITIMATYTKGISLTAKDKATAHTFSTKSIDTKANGEITHSQEKENFSEMENFSSKENSKMA